MIELDRLRIFHAVAKTGSFTRAAEVVHLTQPGISKHIRQMEEYYGVPLFDRLPRKVVLTQAGEVLFEATQEIMGLIAAAEQRIQDLKGLRGGRLHVGASFPIGLYILPGLLAEYRKRYPHIEVQTDIAVSRKIEAKVLANRLDIGLVSSEVNDPGLVAGRFMTDELVVIAPRDHKWSGKARIKAQNLTGETFIMAGREAGTRAIVEKRLKEKGIVLSDVFDFVNAEGVKRAVEAGLGISIQARSIVRRELADGSLCAIRITDIDNKIGYLRIFRKNRRLSNAAQALLELLPESEKGEVAQR